ncbi:glycosyltransferase family 4 protein [Corynebacterium gallinarum]|uniref:Glycosyltransferase family 4 protein n=1 Tax=Corynebacterium gallinarum TaxID=2762214 RepID=A0A8I0LD02_9CORY|nr:glycosyltransferase family 4 protein [Corynebacterium gallinarum]MBD8031021.1 glycosyltransferase family 4 protein [Corynebacterium gallinarum]
MKILVLSQYFPPENSFYPDSVARNLSARGHSVRVLTGYPNYPEGIVHSGYKQCWRMREETSYGVEVLRVPLYTDHSQNALRRIMNYVSFGLSSATALKWVKDVDVIYVYAPQPTAAIGPWIWRRLGGAPYVVHVQDLWPDSITGSALVSKKLSARVIEKIINIWLKSIYKVSSGVIGIAPQMVKRLAERGNPKDRPHLIFNWADDHGKELELDESHFGEKAIKFIFAGNIGNMQDVESIVRAADILRNHSIQIQIVGDGTQLDKVKKLARELELENVDFVGKVRREQMEALYTDADFSLVTLKDLPVFEGTIPSKFQGSIANALPVVTTVQGDLREIVEKEDIGFTAESENPASLASAIESAATLSSVDYSDLCARTRAVFVDRFSTKSGIDSLESLLTSVVDSK